MKHTLRYNNGWQVETFEDEKEYVIRLSRKKASPSLKALAQDIIDSINEKGGAS